MPVLFDRNPGEYPGAHFDLSQDVDLYVDWREARLAAAPVSTDGLFVEINDARRLTAAEVSALREHLAATNLVFYRTRSMVDKMTIRVLGRQLGLERLDDNLCADEDGISSIQVAAQGRASEYVPYTRKPLNWHTDGYYNSVDRQVRAIIMHCVRPASVGGGNAFMDHEIAYILLRDHNPRCIAALMQPDVMTIPANISNGRTIRREQTGPVFSVDSNGHLHMRYSARARNVVWKEDPWVKEATAFLTDLFKTGSPYIFQHRLGPGEGIVSNNVLHCRSSFEDDGQADTQRLLYRARYLDRINSQVV